MESDLLSEIKTVCKAVSPKLLDSNHFVVAMDAISSWMKLPAFFGGVSLFIFAFERLGKRADKSEGEWEEIGLLLSSW